MDLDWLQEYQALLGGTLGFIGVIITLVVNATLARKARQDERNHERDTLRTALITELRVHERRLQETIDKSEDSSHPETQYSAFPVGVVDDAYRALLPRLGLLSAGEVEKVMQAYLFLQEVSQRSLLLGELADSAGHYVKIPRNYLNVMTALNKEALSNTTDALNVLGSQSTI